MGGHAPGDLRLPAARVASLELRAATSLGRLLFNDAFPPDFVFHDDNKVGWSIAITMLISAPLAAGLLWFGRAQRE